MNFFFYALFEIWCSYNNERLAYRLMGLVTVLYPNFNTIWMAHHPETLVITYHTFSLSLFFAFVQMVLGFSICSAIRFV